MKKATINITYDEERLNAIRHSFAEKSLELEAELISVLDNLYRKHVHPAVRVYIESRDASAPTTAVKRPINPGKEQTNV